MACPSSRIEARSKVGGRELTGWLCRVGRVILERVGEHPLRLAALLKDVNQLDLLPDSLHPAFQQLQLGFVRQAKLVQPLRLGLADGTGSRGGAGVGVLVVGYQRAPVLVTRPLDRCANVFSSKWHITLPNDTSVPDAPQQPYRNTRINAEIDLCL
jgi:hypothetical protein